MCVYSFIYVEVLVDKIVKPGNQEFIFVEHLHNLKLLLYCCLIRFMKAAVLGKVLNHVVYGLSPS